MTYTLSRTQAWFAKLCTMKKIKYLSNLTLPRLLSPLSSKLFVPLLCGALSQERCCSELWELAFLQRSAAPA